MIRHSLAFGLTLLLGTASLPAAETIAIVVGSKATAIEKDAADELATQWKRLFGVTVKRFQDTIPKSPDCRLAVLVGSTSTNPVTGHLPGFTWPKISNQGLVIQEIAVPTPPKVLVVGGGSPAATFWAVSELGHRLGVRYTFRQDFFPPQKPFKLPRFNIVEEPELRTRTWRTINDFAIGPESWGLEEHKRFIRQLAKMKFNRILMSVYAWQPFVDYRFRGVQRQTALHWFGEVLRVDGDTPGRVAFKGAKIFQNPDFAGLTTYKQKIAAGKKLMTGVIDTSHSLGMTVGLSTSVLEFPKEFADALPGSTKVHQLKSLTIGPGPTNKPDDPVLTELISTRIRAFLKTYPGLDALYVSVPEFPEWNAHAQAAWKELDNRKSLGDHSLEKLVTSARNRNLIASGDRGEASIKGNVVGMAFFCRLFDDGKLLKKPDGSSVELVIRQPDPALFPILDRVLPTGASTLNFVDYTARRIAESKQLLAQLPAKKVKASLIMTLADDNVGVLAQSTTQHIDTLTREIRKLGWDGFSTRYWIPGELDSTVHYLSRASWDAKTTRVSAHHDLWEGILGNRAGSERLLIGWNHLEDATHTLDKNAIGFGFPVPGMFLKHNSPGEPPKWFNDVNDHYTQWMIELYRVQGAPLHRNGSKQLLFYYAKRSEFNVAYLGAVKALKAAATARKAKDLDTAIEQMETAMDQLNGAMTSLADVAQGQSDRGLIATLANFAYRPLVKEYEKLLDEADK
ncbi:MAG: hypothetical protein QF363_22400 [Planctomycetaceae bacterium]|jgi:hypothetical protein|nr:hypothetical protein [Planctomycetaceae bacterium]